jgi:hypothetical protein
MQLDINLGAQAMDDLRSAILKRPGMYFGDLSVFGGFASLLGWMALDAAQAGATRVSCRKRLDGKIELCITPSDLRAELQTVPAVGPFASQYGSSFELAEAVSQHVGRSASDGRLAAVFVPDLDTFPYLAAPSLYPLVGFVHDLATAFPQCGFDVVCHGWSQAPAALRMLAEEGVSAAELFPGYKGVVDSFKEREFWDAQKESHSRW